MLNYIKRVWCIAVCPGAGKLQVNPNPKHGARIVCDKCGTVHHVY